MHASSKRHRQQLRKLALPAMLKGGRKGIRGGLLSGRRPGRRVHDDESMVKVDKYKRNPPTPPWPAWLSERLVRVRDHWRRPPHGGGSSTAPRIPRLPRPRRGRN